MSVSPTDHPAYEAVVGLEVHAQLLTESKIFCADSAAYGGAPNTHVSPITLAHPGTLPVLNEKAIEYAIRMGLACHCDIQRYNYFDRKNYFYPDLPKGYQVTQNTTPICLSGFVKIRTGEEARNIRLHHIHLEEDAGKSLHDQNEDTLVDYNRAGVALIEIVSEPDIRSGEEAYAYLTELRRLVRYLGICDGNMEEGSFRCDANISVRPVGATWLGAKVEVKNMNSIRNVKRAIEYEVKRQTEALLHNEKIIQQTRGFDAQQGTTSAMREKEMANDYRYFPEPDLAPFYISDTYLDSVRQSLPALPEELFIKYTATLGLTEYDAGVLTDDKQVADYFEQLMLCTGNYKAAANWLLGPVRSHLNHTGTEMMHFPLRPQTLAGLIRMVDDGKVSFSTAASRIFPVLLEKQEADPMETAVALNLLQDDQAATISPIVEEVLAQYPDKVKAYKAGKKGLMGLFVGEVMKRSKGRANPQLTNRLLAEKLDD